MESLSHITGAMNCLEEQREAIENFIYIVGNKHNNHTKQKSYLQSHAHALIWLAVWSLYEAFTFRNSGNAFTVSQVSQTFHAIHKEKAAARQMEEQQKYRSGPHTFHIKFAFVFYLACNYLVCSYIANQLFSFAYADVKYLDNSLHSCIRIFSQAEIQPVQLITFELHSLLMLHSCICTLKKGALKQALKELLRVFFF